ncbi:MAG: chemotaxis protein CheX [Kofleriaceae bacterium]
MAAASHVIQVIESIPAERLARSVTRVTSMMMGRDFAPAAITQRPPAWRTAILPIPGATPVTIALSSDRAGCAALAAAMLGADRDALDLAMIDDFLRELANMTGGQIKTELRLDQALGLPRVFDGEAAFTDPEWRHHVLCSQDVSLVVSLIPRLV